MYVGVANFSSRLLVFRGQVLVYDWLLQNTGLM